MYILKSYDDALRYILEYGVHKPNRTGVDTISVFGIESRYRIDEAFPIVTGRKVWPKSIFAELLWFLSGSTNNKDLQAMGSNIWTPWVDPEFEKKHGFAEGSFGPVYGFQLRHFNGYYGNGIGGKNGTQNDLVEAGEHIPELNGMMPDGPFNAYGVGGFDQLSNMISRLKTHPDCRRNLFSLWNPVQFDQMRLPPCFVAGTPVLTPDGFRNINKIKMGDVVCANGKNQKVYETHCTEYNGDLIELKLACLSGLPLKSTPNHPYWVKDKGWVKAEDISENDYLFLGINDNSDDPEFDALFIGGKDRSPKKYKLTLNDWWLIGYYLGDGWRNKDRISFAVSEREKAYILPKIRESLKVSKKPDKLIRSCYTYETKSKKWEVILKDLGRKALYKKIPSWVLNAPIDCLTKLIEGYYDSDGCDVNKNYHSFNTVSKKLALGIQQIFWKIDRRASVNFHKRESTCVIEGRTVNQRSFYSIVAKIPGTKINKQSNFELTEKGVWLKVKNKKVYKSNERVFNLSVEQEHEYYAAGIRTHNCHYTFQVYVANGKLSGLLTQRSCDFPIGVPANIQFYSALIYILAQLTDLKPYEFVHSTVDSHIYVNQIDAVKEYLARPKPDSPKLNLNKRENVSDYVIDDFQLVDYNPLTKIEIPVAV